jgi:hypothetical protein
MRSFPKTLVLYLDGVPDDTGEIFDPKGLCFVPECLISKNPGSTSVDDIIGRAKLYIGDDSNLYADIDVFNYVDGPLKLYPSVVGTCLERNEFVLSQTVVKGLGLTTNKNTDKRIQPIDLPAPFTRTTLPMCKLPYQRISNESMVEQPGEELNPKDDIIFIESALGPNGCACLVGYEIHHGPNDFGCCSGVVVACGNCDMGAAVAEGADWGSM